MYALSVRAKHGVSLMKRSTGRVPCNSVMANEEAADLGGGAAGPDLESWSLFSRGMDTGDSVAVGSGAR